MCVLDTGGLRCAYACAQVQTVVCETTDDTTAQFTLTFRDETTATIAGNSDEVAVEAALEVRPPVHAGCSNHTTPTTTTTPSPPPPPPPKPP